ncbi:hypothetical protein ABZV34_34750 [Streptomyces sp. NPDC005195]
MRAAALEAIDEGQDAKHAHAEVWALNVAVRDCRTDRVHLYADQAS